MPQGNSTNREQPTTTLRRSPRFLGTDREDPKTPKPEQRRYRVPSSDPPSLRSTRKLSSKKTQKRYPKDVSKKVNESSIGSKNSVKSIAGSRRSARLNGGVVGFSCRRRSPRFSGKGKTDGCVETIGLEKSKQEGLSEAGKAEVGIYSHKQFAGKLEKRATRSSTRANTDENAVKTGNSKDNELRTTHSSVASLAVIEGGGERKGGDIDKGRKRIGVKRKRNQVEGGHGIVQGWTKDQDLALQRAYLAAKPTPHFWKKVARLVPGKSAQDCFDKVHSDHLTPPQPHSRSRANRTNLSSLSLSASKLLNSTESKHKKPRHSKQKSHLAQKTVRQLLQKQSHVDQDHEADLFSVLEPTLNPSAEASQQGIILSTPERNQEKPGFLKRCQERSSSAHKKHLSRFSSSCGATLVSPPVLKQVKNKVLHEKYIDQLHCREAKRKAASARTAKFSKGKVDRKESHVPKMDAVKAAKIALVLDARDAINQFQHLETTAMSNFSDADDDGVDSDEDEGEDRR